MECPHPDDMHFTRTGPAGTGWLVLVTGVVVLAAPAVLAAFHPLPGWVSVMTIPLGLLSIIGGYLLQGYRLDIVIAPAVRRVTSRHTLLVGEWSSSVGFDELRAVTVRRVSGGSVPIIIRKDGSDVPLSDPRDDEGATVAAAHVGKKLDIPFES